MTSISDDTTRRKVIIGVDTHKHIHVAVAIDHHGARLGDLSVSADTGGYTQLEQWAQALGRIDRFGIEGTGSYGAGLTSFLRRCGHRIVEVNRGDRRSRRQNGKSDTLDAEAAARSVLAGTSAVVPKSGDGVSEVIRQIKIARDTARKGRTTAIITLKTIVVNAPAELRESLDGMTDRHAPEALLALPPRRHRRHDRFSQARPTRSGETMDRSRQRDHRTRQTPRRPHRTGITDAA